MTGTEAPTKHRVLEARREGRVAYSPAFAGAFVLVAGLVIAGVWLPRGMAALSSILVTSLSLVASPPPPSMLPSLLAGIAVEGAWIVAPVAIAAFGSALVAGLVQVGPLIAWRVVLPDVTRLGGGVSRSAWERLARIGPALLCGLFFVGIVAIEAPAFLRVVAVGPTDLAAALSSLGSSLRAVAWWAAASTLVAGLADFGLARYFWARSLRMTREQIRRERASHELSPDVAREGRRRMKAGATIGWSSANLLLADGLDVVGISYQRRAAERPRVAGHASGREGELRRAWARERGVSVVESAPELVAALGALRLGDPLPNEYYAALAHCYAKQSPSEVL